MPELTNKEYYPKKNHLQYQNFINKYEYQSKCQKMEHCWSNANGQKIHESINYSTPDNLNLSLYYKSVGINKPIWHFCQLHEFFPPPVMLFLPESVQCICKIFTYSLALMQKNKNSTQLIQ